MRILAWALFVGSCALVVLQGVFVAASNYALLSADVLVDQAFPLLGIGAIVGAGVGAMIVSRYPRNVIGWLLIIGQFGSCIGLAAEALRILAAQGVVDRPWVGQLAGYLHDVFGATLLVADLSVLFMIAPDGRLLSRRWRLAVAVPISALVFQWIAVLTTPASVYLPDAVVDLSLFHWVPEFTSFFLLLLAISLGAVALVLRTRRSAGQQRLQLRWISTSAAILAVTFVLFALSQFLPLPTTWILPLAACLAYIFFSVSVGVAVFRYRLYDINVILSRAIVLGVLALFVTVGYVGVVVAISAVLGALGEPGSWYWPSLVATALVATAFQPLRRHVLKMADQLVYGNRAAPYEALAALSRRLADSPSPDEIPARVAEATGRSVGAAHTLVSIGAAGPPKPTGRGTPLATARWPAAAGGPAPARGPEHLLGETVTLPVLDMNEQVGSIQVTMPAGRALRPFELHLLQDVAAQAGIAFRNALLQAELGRRVAESAARSAELTASRRRLVGAEDEARERLADAISREVVPHLAIVEDALSVGGPQAPAPLGSLINEIELALEQLRLVCRGVFPALLERRGLVPALSAQLAATHSDAVLEVADSADRRLDRAAEAAGYLFCVDVAPTDRACTISVFVRAEQLTATITGDEPWVMVTEPGPDGAERWQHVRDRVAALDGTISVRRTPNGAMSVTALIPLSVQPDGELVTTSQTSASRSGPNSDLGT